MAEKSSWFNSPACGLRQNYGVRGRKETRDKCLDAIKEDLASWFTQLLGTVITSDTFTSTLDTGVVLCQLANLIQSTGENYVAVRPSDAHRNCFPLSGTTYKKRTAFPGSFIARDNVANFIRWCRELGVPDTIMFESDDVVLQKNEKCILLTLMEVARRAAKVGVEPPELIRMENEIDQEMDRGDIEADVETDLESLQEHVVLTSRNLCRKKSHSLDDLVYQVLEQCTCAPVKYHVVRIAEGKYRMGEQKTLIFVRVMRKNVMVRVGGGWDTLERYFDKHDPCRMHEPRQHRSSVKIPRCRGNEDFNRSPSSLSLCSVSSTDSQDSYNTSSSSHLSSSTWPAQSAKRQRDMTKQHASRNPPSSPRLGQSRPKRTGTSSRVTPPRTIETQAARNRRSKSMHELNELSVEAVMGPLDRPVKAQGRRQSGASTKTASNSTPERDPAPQKPFCSTVSRSSSFGSCTRAPPYLKCRSKSVIEASSLNGFSSSGSSGGKEMTNEQDEKQRKAARERSRTVQREVRTGPASRRGKSAPRELEATQRTPRERSKTLPRREQNSNTAGAVRAERSKIPQRKPRDPTPQRKLSKTADTAHAAGTKKSATSEVLSSQSSKSRRTSKQTVSQREQKTSAQRLSEKRNKDEMKDEVHDSKSASKTNSPETQQSGQGEVPVLISLEPRESNGTGENQTSTSGEDHTEVNDEEAIAVLYETLLIDSENQAKEDNTRIGSLAEESAKFDGTLAEETEWKNDCLRLVRVIDFSERENDCNRRHLDLESSRLHSEKPVQPVVQDLEVGSSELKNSISIGGEGLRGKAVTSKVTELRGNGMSSREDGSPQVPRRRPVELNLEIAPRDRIAMAPSQKACESDSRLVHALSNPRSKAMYFDVDQHSRISEGNSDTASTPESPFDSPRKVSLVQSMISNIESRSPKHETSISPRAKQPVMPTRKWLERTQDRPAGMQPKTCATDGNRAHTTVENNVNAGDKNGFQSTVPTDQRIGRRSSSDKNPNITHANHSHISELAPKTPEHVVPEVNEDPTWRKESLDGSKEPRHTKETGSFPRPQGQFTLEEMIEDMMPQEQGNAAMGKAISPSHNYKQGSPNKG